MTFGILGNIDKPVLKEVTEHLLRYLKETGISYVIHEDIGRLLDGEGTGAGVEPEFLVSEQKLLQKSDMLIALGGDGTMLATARLVGARGVPVLGVNLGKLGFLAEVSVSDMHDCIAEIARGQYLVEERTVLQARNEQESRPFFALNEVVVDRGSSPRVIELETHVNGEYLVTYAADGIITTTPTGSTAYSLASGGPIVVPQSNVLTINPISPHTLTARAVIVPDDSVITVAVRSSSKPVHMTADGQIEGFFETPTTFVIQKAPYTVKLVKRMKRSYFDLLRTKLMWGRDLRLGSSG
jgi:NAD+ kinase